MRIETWNIEQETGYKPITTIYEDFSIADAFGVGAIKDTYNNLNNNLSDYKEITEFAMALNWKCWRWYGHNDTYSKLYVDLFYKLQDHIYNTFTKEQLSYYYKTTD